MARRVFYSFHYKPDNWRASQVRNMGVIAGNAPVSENEWETITKGGDRAIQRWIDNQLNGTSCTIILIGENTAGRKWINYEIKESWDDGKGVLGIYIHNLKNMQGTQTIKGQNPFNGFDVKGKQFSSIVKAYDPPYGTSKDVYAYINEALQRWVNEAILIRNRH